MEIDNFPNIPHLEWIKKNYISAIEQKLFPDFELLENSDLTSWFFEIKKVFIDFFIYYEEKRLSKKIPDLIRYAYEPKKVQKMESLLTIKKMIKRILRLKDSEYTNHHDKLIGNPYARFLSIMPLLLDCRQKEGYKISELYSSCEILGIEKSNDLKSLWNNAVSNYLMEWRPSGEAKNVANKELIPA
jgi:hypothetical protein